MSAKAILVFCVHIYFIQTALTQCTSRAAIDASGFTQLTPYSWVGPSVASPAYERFAAPVSYNGLATWAGRPCDGFYSPREFTPSSGGGLPVTSISAISPTGISVKSDNAYEGTLTVIGEMPFVSAVAVEGKLPTGGAGAINYGCGNGVVAMLSEGTGPVLGPNVAPGAYPGAFGPNAAFGYGGGYGSGVALGLGNGFGPVAGFGSAAGLAPANRLGLGGCGRGMVY